MEEFTIRVYGTIAKTYRVEAENEIEAEDIACSNFKEDHPEAVIDDWEFDED